MKRGPTGQKAPSYQFYPRDFDGDTRMLTLESTGAYIRFLNSAHFANPRGSIEFNLTTWGIFWGVDTEAAARIIDALATSGVCYVSITCNKIQYEYNAYSNGEVTLDNADITIENKRMVREGKANEANRLSQKKFREKRNENCKQTEMIDVSKVPSNAEVILRSSTSTSSSVKDRDKSLSKNTQKDSSEQEQKITKNGVPTEIIENAFQLFGNTNAGLLSQWGKTYGWKKVAEALRRSALVGSDKGRKAVYVHGILRSLALERWSPEKEKTDAIAQTSEFGASGWETDEDVKPRG